MPVTRSKSNHTNGNRVNYSERDADRDFNKRLQLYNSPEPTIQTRSQSNRKRKQIDSDDYHPPPNKRQKTYHHVDTPHPQRRSTRIALKQSLNPQTENNENTDNYEDEIENEEKDVSQPASIHHTASMKLRRSTRNASKKAVDFESNGNNVRRRSQRLSTRSTMNGHNNNENSDNGYNGHNGHSNGHNGHTTNNFHDEITTNNETTNNWNGRLRRSARNKHIKTQSSMRQFPDDDEDEDDDTKKKGTRQDSDYGDKEFEQDLEDEDDENEDENEDEDQGPGYTDDMNEADEANGYGVINEMPRRRSARIRQKNEAQHHESDIELETDKKYDEEEQDKSNSLPLSLRRPKRNRKPPTRIYEEAQQLELLERRQTLRTRKPVNYAESPNEDESDSDDDDDGVSVTTSTKSSSRRSSTYSSRKNTRKSSRNKPRSRRRGRGGGRRRRGRRSRSTTYNDSSSEYSSESYSTDTLMDIHEQKRLARERRRIKPIQIQDLGLYHEAMAPNLSGRQKPKTAAADISPMEIDMNISWNMVGGLQSHVQKLKEMVVLPLLYPKEFAQFKMSTPKGVLFHGPPGTGKTLVARILAAQCSMGTNPDGTPRKKVSFYMRKGADCLSKWVGEAERQLRLLFDEAHKNQPAVIFFDEIDGLAPVRSSRQDQIHSSIVSTLLALMDGLDSRGQIIVIGATNRPDAIDPALRRPGRFDRELCFNLPTRQARKDILKIHTKSWNDTNCKLDDEMLKYLSEESVGYCGADLEALCREAFLAAVRRTYPQIYHSNLRLQIDTKKLQVIQEDFQTALKQITPSSQRSSLVYAKALPQLLTPLLQRQLDNIKRDISARFALRKQEYDNDENVANCQENDNHNHNNKNEAKRKLCSQQYRYLIHGPDSKYGQSYLGRAVLHLMEEYPMYSLDLASIMGDSTTKGPQESILRIFKEAQRNTPSVIYWPHIDRWWAAASDEALRTSITLLIDDLSHDCPILIVATSNVPMAELDPQLQKIFEKSAFHDTSQPIDQQQRKKFWSQIKEPMKEKPKHKPKSIEQYPSLPIAELPRDDETNQNDLERLKQKQKTDSEKLIESDKMACVQLRTYIRAICTRLCKHFKNFIDKTTEDGVVQNKLSLFEIRQRNNERKVPTVIAFLQDIDQLVNNVKQSAQTESLKARQFINEACHLQDQALSMMSQVNRELVKQCDKLAQQQLIVTNNNNMQRRVSFADEQDINNNINNNDQSHNHNQKRKSSLRSNNGDNNNDDIDIDCQDKDENESEEAQNGEMDIDTNDNEKEENEDVDDEDNEVKINENKINQIINKLVKVSEGYVVEKMEEKMYGLLRIIYQYSNKWDRSELIQELNDEIKQYFKPNLLS